MKHKLLHRAAALVLALVLCLSILPAAGAAGNHPTEAEVYERILALREKYPTGTPWDNSYTYGGGRGCHGFALLVSDAAFGDLPYKKVMGPLKFQDVRVGDIIRVLGDTHSMVVLRIVPEGVYAVEGNCSGRVRWGDFYTKSQIEAGKYMLTRYPYAKEDATPEPVTPPPPQPDPLTGFVDVKKSGYYYDALVWAKDNDIVAGTSKTTFSPNAQCDRGQIVTFLWRALGKPMATSFDNPFLDVKLGSYYEAPVLWAVHGGVTSGTSQTTFTPGATVTRQDTVTFIWRALGCPEPEAQESPFADVQDPESYSYKAILWGYENGIVSGVSSTRFAPKDPCTRAQIVTFLYRAFA